MTPTALGVDVGGTGIKAGIVDLTTCALVGDRRRIPTPAARTPEVVLPAIANLIGSFDYEGPIGIGCPAVIRGGVFRTPFAAYQVPGWIGVSIVDTMLQRNKVSIVALNDADAAGIAERRVRPASDFSGKTLVLTLGTGIGSALFLDGRLVPNLELGHLYLRGQASVAEAFAAERARVVEKLPWPVYAERVETYLRHLERLFSPDRIFIGGGIDLAHPEFLPNVHIDTPVSPAKLGKDAGIIGAAIAASEDEPRP